MRNYIKIFSLFVGSAFFNFAYGQNGKVGINTDNPQQKLHVSGAKNVLSANIGDTTGVPLISPTMRIDGLNFTNNPSAFSTIDTTGPFYVDSSGDTTVKKGEQKFSFSAPQTDAITSTSIFDVDANAAYQLTGNLLSVTFTLTQRSMVFISATLSADVRSSGGGTLNDGNARAVVALLQFTAAPPSSGITVNSSFMSDGFTFANRAANGSVNTFKLNPSTEAVLPTGTYTLVLKAGAIGANQASDDFTVIFGGGAGDKLNVLAKPL